MAEGARSLLVLLWGDVNANSSQPEYLVLLLRHDSKTDVSGMGVLLYVGATGCRPVPHGGSVVIPSHSP